SGAAAREPGSVGFELTAQELTTIAAGRQRRFGGDPESHEEF
ncbi:hypothetical protein GA0115253_104531, partial [Streptomyces sp. Termitarium-T10T-6]